MIQINDRERLDAEQGQAACEANGYTDYTRFTSGRDACITRLGFNHAILSDLTYWGYGDRWCFASYDKARRALTEWAAADGEGEPNGWHRHPDTGRRRENGDPATEEIRF